MLSHHCVELQVRDNDRKRYNVENFFPKIYSEKIYDEDIKLLFLTTKYICNSLAWWMVDNDSGGLFAALFNLKFAHRMNESGNL